jgi:hypothetical protein
MKTLFFPYTTIDPRQAEQMAAIWGALTLLQPSPETSLPAMAFLQEAGIIEMVFPASDTKESLTDVLQNLKQWAAQHTGGDLALMMEQRQAIPFFNDQSSAQIVAEIRKGGKTPAEDPAAAARKKIFQAQLLLAMAQEYDLQQAALTRDIETLSARENEMMALLKGEDVADTIPVSSSWTPGAEGSAAMITLRLKAWARAMAAVEGMEILSGKSADVLFLTNGRGVLAQIQEIFPEAETCLCGHRITAGRTSSHEMDRLPVWLADPLANDNREESGQNGGLSPGFDLVEIPRMSVAKFLLRLSGHRPRAVSDDSVQTNLGACWVGCMTWMGDDYEESVDAGWDIK